MSFQKKIFLFLFLFVVTLKKTEAIDLPPPTQNYLNSTVIYESPEQKEVKLDHPSHFKDPIDSSRARYQLNSPDNKIKKPSENLSLLNAPKNLAKDNTETIEKPKEKNDDQKNSELILNAREKFQNYMPGLQSNTGMPEPSSTPALPIVPSSIQTQALPQLPQLANPAGSLQLPNLPSF